MWKCGRGNVGVTVNVEETKAFVERLYGACSVVLTCVDAEITLLLLLTSVMPLDAVFISLNVIIVRLWLYVL